MTSARQRPDRRDAVRHALSSYLDLVNVLLAGGARHPRRRSKLQRKRRRLGLRRDPSRPPARTGRPSLAVGVLAELGERLGVDELLDLSASVQLAGEQGGAVRASLAAKAASLRAHQMAHVEAEAQSRANGWASRRCSCSSPSSHCSATRRCSRSPARSRPGHPATHPTHLP